MSPPLPIILCGKTPDVGRIVVAGLKPEYEVIHFVTSLSDASKIIPALLQGKPPPKDENGNVGSGNYSKIPIAVVVPAKYDDGEVAAMMQTCYGGGGKGCRRVPWLRPDESKAAPQWGEPEYWQQVLKRIKVCLGGLELGQDGEGKERVVYY